MPYGRNVLKAGPEDFAGYADGDGAFAAWCQEVDRLAHRFAGASFFEFEDLMDTETEYRHGTSPIRFVRQCIIPEIVCDMGYDFVEDVVADHVMWGCSV